jgi:hypothetical protein
MLRLQYTPAIILCKPSSLVIVHDITDDDEIGPRPPLEPDDGLWVEVRRANGCTVWMRITLQP